MREESNLRVRDTYFLKGRGLILSLATTPDAVIHLYIGDEIELIPDKGDRVTTVVRGFGLGGSPLQNGYVFDVLVSLESDESERLKGAAVRVNHIKRP